MSTAAQISAPLTIDHFTPHVGKMLMVEAHPKSIGVRLESIKPGLAMDAQSRMSFVLTFTTPWTDMLLEGMYLFHPASAPAMEIYLIPTQTAPGERRYYHAVFN